jgi:chaperonin GroEL
MSHTHKQMLFHAAAREKVLRGATALAEAVRVTLGPKSKSVLIGKPWGGPIVCNDGVTIARELELKDPEEDLGVKIIRQAAERTGDAVGDGTTTSMLLAHAMFAEGLRNVAAGASAIDLKRGLERGLRAAVESIRGAAKPVASRREKVQVATISAHNDAAIGELVGDAVERVGGDGVITVEEAKGTETAVEVVQGMRFDRGYLSPYFVTDPERMECVLHDALVLLHDRRGQIAAEEAGVKLEHMTTAQLGRAARVVVTQDATTLVGGAGDARAVAGRVEQLRRLAREAKSSYDREKFEERLAKLAGGVAVVRVGAPSEAELKARKDAFEDAISATKAAVAEGVVPGAGLPLLRAADAVARAESSCEGDERSGVRVLRHALEAPTRQIAANSGADAGVVVERMRNGAGDYGFDAAKGAYVDLVEAGIIDPAKVMRVALENAVSVAGVLLLTEATMTEIAEPAPKLDAPSPLE